DVCDRHRRHRDRTRRELEDAIREVAAGLHVYRAYVRPGSLAPEQDQRQISIAAEEAARRRPDIDADLLAFVAELLLMRYEGAAEAEFTARFQQLTPAVMGKGVEDTAFYRYNRLVSLNEVGGDPGKFGRPLEEFHSYCSRIAAKWPTTMLTLSTHDTKRSGDVRARINLLSEIPAEWESAVRRWAEHNERHRAQGYPDRNLEYLMYQTVVGARPVDHQRLAALLSEIRGADAQGVLARADEGAPKLWLITRLLGQRRIDPELFGSTSYTPLAVVGTKSRHAVGFVRDRLLVVVPRPVAGLGGDWADTTVELPAGSWRSLLTGEEVKGGRAIPVAELMRHVPVAV